MVVSILNFFLWLAARFVVVGLVKACGCLIFGCFFSLFGLRNNFAHVIDTCERSFASEFVYREANFVTADDFSISLAIPSPGRNLLDQT